MSPRAAWRLEQLGFTEVYDYRGGKEDWKAAGLGREGQATDRLTAGDVVRVDVPTCAAEDVLGDVRTDDWDLCVVTNARQIALGALDRGRVERHDDDARVGDVMDVLPYTRRPSTDLETMVEQLDRFGVDHVLITTPEGRFIGVLYADDARQAPASPDR